LAYEGKTLDGHGQDRHAQGFSSPVGKLKGEMVPLEFWHLTEGDDLVLHYESGILIAGKIVGVIREASKNILVTLTDCTVIDRLGEELFSPGWGDYDLAVGDQIVSVFGGMADKTVFNKVVEPPLPVAPVYSSREKELQDLYRQVRELGQGGPVDHGLLWQKLQQYPNDWLCALELLEVLRSREQDSRTESQVILFLEKKALLDRQVTKLIRDGLAMLEEPVSDG